jgi:hypothetical protein
MMIRGGTGWARRRSKDIPHNESGEIYGMNP